jgi:hypothetical protein
MVNILPIHDPAMTRPVRPLRAVDLQFSAQEIERGGNGGRQPVFPLERLARKLDDPGIHERKIPFSGIFIKITKYPCVNKGIFRFVGALAGGGHDTAGDRPLSGGSRGIGARAPQQAPVRPTPRNMPFLERLAPGLFEAAKFIAAKALATPVGFVNFLMNDGVYALKRPTHTEFTRLIESEGSVFDTDVLNRIALPFLEYNPVTLGAEGVYHMGVALLEENCEALRNETWNMPGLFGSMRLGDTPALRRELQPKVKQTGFLTQQLTRGVIEKTPLRDLLSKDATTKRYMVETALRDADGRMLPGSREVVLSDGIIARICDGILEIDEKGEVVYKVCFAPGTLVHTDQGLVPIEKIRVGMKVFSQPEDGGERAYRPVINTVAHLDQPVHAVQIKVEGADSLTTVIATGNHPFWVEAPLVGGEHWMATECLEPGFVLQLADGRKAVVHAAGLVRRTQHPDIGFMADDRVGAGVAFDLANGIQIADGARVQNLGALQLGEPWLTPVYNFEVDGFHTYYVEEAGVWVHNANYCNSICY